MFNGRIFYFPPNLAKKETMALTTQLQEWFFCRVILEADKDVVPRRVQPPGAVGAGKDIAQCVFCLKEYQQALVNRVRNHVAGGGVGAKEAGISKCPGAKRYDFALSSTS